MKKLLALILTLALTLCAAGALTSCGASDKAPEGTVTRMTVDINPSVELMVNDQNVVTAVTALNDDGSILICGEAIVGKDAEAAVELIVSVAGETGYLVSGSAKAGENEVKISVSGDTSYAKKLSENVQNAAREALEKSGITATVKAVDALGTDALRALVKTSTSYTDEEIDAMTSEEMLRALADARYECAALVTEDLRRAYNEAKEYKIALAEREETVAVIERLGALYGAILTPYKDALARYSEAIESVENLRYEMLISPESEYQKALTALRDSKAEFLKERNYVASLSVDDVLYVEASASLQTSEAQYNALYDSVVKLGDAANTAVDQLIAALRTAEGALKTVESSLLSQEAIKKALADNAAAMDTALNEAKDSFFAEFEKAHRADIDAVKAELAAKKAELKENAKN